MKKKIYISAFLIWVFVLAGCGKSDTANQDSETVISEESTEKENKEVDNTETIDDSKDNFQGNPSMESAINMQNITLGTVPTGYYSNATQQGTLETFTYDTKDYIGDGKAIQSQATVYLPYGYAQNDEDTRYNILYLQHGAYGNERTWMYEYGDDFKNLIDNMIEDNRIPPLIIVMPYLPSGNDWYHDTTPIFYSGELKNDLMPAVESYYHTFASSTTDAGFEESRSHRAFGGFSAGGTTTWHVFLEGMDRFEYFLPMSGGLTLGGDGSTDVADATTIADTAAASGYDKREYYVFAATGTEDVAYQGLTAQMEYMKTLTNAFDYTDKGFADGNLMYYTVDGNQHDYQYTYEYVFNGLQCLFSWYEGSITQESATDSQETLTVVTTAGEYEIPLTDLAHQTGKDTDSKVFYTSEISSDALIAIYKALGRTPSKGDNVAVKLHTGEGDGSYNLEPDLIKELVQSVDGTIVECNTAYGGNRSNTAMHMQIAEDHGYTAIADVDIMDADGGMEIPVTGGTHLKTDLVGAHLANYDFCIVLSHFKGHAMGGFGGALKNISIGIASSTGKSLIHSGGTETTGFGWDTSAETFTESMAEAASAVYDYFDDGEKIVFINVMNNVSVDCDCNANPAKPDMHDVGILASTDSVALDQACVDFLRAVPDGASVIRRMESRSGEHILDHADELGFGSRNYKLVSID